MRHDVSLSGLSLRLRPVTDDDAALIVSLRGDPVRGAYLHRGAQTEADQRLWLRDYYAREGDYYFVAERIRDGSAEGLISLYDVTGQSGEWGRWILRPNSVAAVESAWMIYRVGFDVLGLTSMYCRTAAVNEQVVSFHDSCGLPRSAVIPGCFTIAGMTLDAIEHRIDRPLWLAVGARLERLASLLAARAADT